MEFDIDGFWRDVLAQNREALPAWFAPGAQVLRHCSNERFSADEFIRANCEYPGDWDREIQRRLWAGDTLITVTRVFSKNSAISCHVTSFFRFDRGKIARLDEYWGDDGPPPLWRQEMGIGGNIL